MRKAMGYMTLEKIIISQNCWINKLIVTAEMKMRRVEMETVQKQILPYQSVYQETVFANNVNMDFPQQKKNITIQFRRKLKRNFILVKFVVLDLNLVVNL